MNNVWFGCLRSTAALLGLLLAYLPPALADPDLYPAVMEQVTGVGQLADVQPTDWAVQAVQSLAERYGCLAGYPDGPFRGNRSLSRYEFTAGLNACLDRLNQQIQNHQIAFASREDLDTVQRLQTEFAAELATLRDRLDNLQLRTAGLPVRQFSATTKLTGQVVFVVNSGGFTGDRLVDPIGRVMVTTSPNPTTIYRLALDFNSSFTGTDLLKVRLGAASGGANDNAAAILEPNFGSGLDFSSKPPSFGSLEITRLYYSFRPVADLTVTIAPDMRITDFVDFSRYANLGFRDFSTEALINNYVLFPINGPTTGVVAVWNPGKVGLTFRAVYAAADAANPNNRGILRGTASFIRLLYPIFGNPATASLGNRGLFGDTYQGFIEAEYAASTDFALRLQYTGGAVYGHHFDGLGANIEWTIAKQVGIFGRYGYSSYPSTQFGNLQPNYWMAGIMLRDIGQKGASAGIAVAQPFVESKIGSTTQTNIEVFYNLPVNDSILIAPVFQVITNSSNQITNGTILSGSIRTVLSF